ncbi:MAG: TIGR02444 family protein [Pseudomonadota bacterium]
MSETLENPFWDYSLKIYGQSGFSPAIIGFQDRHGLVVNLLIYCLWAAANGRRLDSGHFALLEDAIAPWEVEVTQPLRAARRWLKGQDLVPEENAKALGKAILARELEGEQLEQWIIAQTVPIAPGEPVLEAAASNLLSYLRQAGITPDADDRAALATLLAAAFPDAAAVEIERLLGG